MEKYEGTLMDAQDLTMDTLLDGMETDESGELFVEQLEELIRKDPANSEVVLQLGLKYKEMGRLVQSAHWFRKLMRDFGIMEYEDELMDIYMTGIGGPELVEEAEAYYVRNEEKRLEQWIKNYFGPEKKEYPESLLVKMKELLAYEHEFYTMRSKLYEKGYGMAGPKEKERIMEENWEKRKKKEEINQKMDQYIADIVAEKEKCGVTDPLFFDFPISRDSSVDYIYDAIVEANSEKKRYVNCERSTVHLYTMGSTGEGKGSSYRWHRQGIKDDDYPFITASIRAGEMRFYYCDKEHKLIDKNNQAGMENDKKCYYAGLGGGRIYEYRSAKKILKDERFVLLYCDWEFLKQNQDEQYVFQYLWDTEYHRRGGYYTRVNSNPLKAAFLTANELTEIVDEIGTYYKTYDEYILDTTRMDATGVSEKKDPHVMRVMKKAAVLWHEDTLVAVLVPKVKSDVVNFHGNQERFMIDGDTEEKWHYAINDSELMTGTNWEHMVATVIHYVCKKFTPNMKPFDITEPKPEGLTDEMWSWWIRQRYRSEVDFKNNVK